jgi:hypothetical protein
LIEKIRCSGKPAGGVSLQALLYISNYGYLGVHPLKQKPKAMEETPPSY